jgi:nucleoside-diphosphate-sugar epimerase
MVPASTSTLAVGTPDGTVRVAVLGGGGFVGAAVLRATVGAGAGALALRAPRLRSAAGTAGQVLAEAASPAVAEARHGLAELLRGVEVVVNAAGDSDAAGVDRERLIGANALMPAVAYLAARDAGVRRLVHVSSAAVQGRRDPLDESLAYDPFSPYAESKCLGEAALLAAGVDGGPDLVVYRPPSVHGVDRGRTRTMAAIAGSQLRSVAGDGRRPSPQALVDNVGAAVAYLCTADRPATVVIHPWEGLTAASLQETFGAGRRPRRIPEPVARLALRAGWATVGRMPARAADLRRVEMLWFGQGQVDGWLTRQGWRPPSGADGWATLAHHMQKRAT